MIRITAMVVGVAVAVQAAERPPAPKPETHETRQVEGWTVRVDTRLLAGPDKDLGDRALRLLANQLYAIAFSLPADRVERLRQVPIQLDRTHGRLVPMQYHPSAAWLRGNGYDTNLARCVHIPDAAYFANPRDQRRQPWAALHELAHAYHDQVLGFGDPEIRAAWKRTVESGRFDHALQIEGRHTRHYALTDEKEFFAEMTESYVGMNDFFPFNRAELQESEPETFALMERIWSGPDGPRVRGKRQAPR